MRIDTILIALYNLTGLNIFRRIRATDRDKPNTPNSDVQYAITAGNERGKFALDSSHQAFLLLSKPLDYDAGDREFTITVTASVSMNFYLQSTQLLIIFYTRKLSAVRVICAAKVHNFSSHPSTLKLL